MRSTGRKRSRSASAGLLGASLSIVLRLGLSGWASNVRAQVPGPEIRDLWSESDDNSDIYLNGQLISGQHLPYCGWPGLSNVDHASSLPMLAGKNLLAVEAQDVCGGYASFISWFTYQDGFGNSWQLFTDSSWRFSDQAAAGWNTDLNFNDSSWLSAVENGPYASWPITDPSVIAPPGAFWIWDADRTVTHTCCPVYSRFKFSVDTRVKTSPHTWGTLKASYR